MYQHWLILFHQYQQISKIMVLKKRIVKKMDNFLRWHGGAVVSTVASSMKVLGLDPSQFLCALSVWVLQFHPQSKNILLIGDSKLLIGVFVSIRDELAICPGCIAPLPYNAEITTPIGISGRKWMNEFPVSVHCYHLSQSKMNFSFISTIYASVAYICYCHVI